MRLDEAIIILEAFQKVHSVYRAENPISVRVEWDGLLDITPPCEVVAWPSKDHDERRAVKAQTTYHGVASTILDAVRQVEEKLSGETP